MYILDGRRAPRRFTPRDEPRKRVSGPGGLPINKAVNPNRLLRRYLTKGMGPHRDSITSGTPAGARYRVTVRPWRWETLALDPGWRPWAQRS